MSAPARFPGNVLSFFSFATVVLTVASLPWMLGGVVPAARLVLLGGSIIAATLSFLASLLHRRLPATLPVVMIPVVCLAMLGTLQLRPSEQSIALAMHHSVAEAPVLAEDSVGSTHSLTPADTRSTISTLLALGLLAIATFEHLRSQHAIIAASLVFVANAVLVTVIGMGELFGQQGLRLNEKWYLGWGQGKSTFAGFVNPNNAAGWLCLAVAVGAGWATWYLKPSSTAPKLRHGRLRVSLWGRLWQRTVEKLADLTVWQALSFAGISFLVAGVASTKSRGGILALIVGVIITSIVRSSIRRLPVVLLCLAIGGGMAFGLLRSLDLDENIMGQMQTLSDLESASKIRVDHWSDSLNVVKDFPLTGTGLGSYRFATLPYQSSDVGVWFRNADNYYVDMVVEGGMIGLLLFISVGLCGILTGMAAWKQSKVKTISRHKDIPRVSRRFMAALGTTVMLATLTQACASFFDYGIGLPAASSLLVVIVASTAGFLTETAVEPTIRSSGSFRSGVMVVACVQLCLIGAAGSYIVDQYAATELDEAVVEGYRMMRPPVDADRLDRISETRIRLETELRKRPDDPEALRLLCRLKEAELRWHVMITGNGSAVREAEDLNDQWEKTTLHTLSEELGKIEQNTPDVAAQLRKQLTAYVDRIDLTQSLLRVQQNYPLMPRIALTSAIVSVLEEDSERFQWLSDAIQFGEPAHADTLFQTGVVALQAGKIDTAEVLWTKSLGLSDKFRTAMLTKGQGSWEETRLFTLFGPQDYSACVRAGKNPGDPILAQHVWAQADQLWETLPQPVDAETAILRLDHLRMNRRNEEAVSWLESAVKSHSENIPLLEMYAKHLADNGSTKAALEQWHRIQFLDPDNPKAADAIDNLRSSEE